MQRTFSCRISLCIATASQLSGKEANTSPKFAYNLSLIKINNY